MSKDDQKQQQTTTQDDDSLEAWEEWAIENIEVWVEAVVNE